MEWNEIARLATDMYLREDLLSLLNCIKSEVLPIANPTMRNEPFTARQLSYYCNSNNNCTRYRDFPILKKSGGVRWISAPRTRTFKLMLQAVNVILKSLYTPSNHAMGFTEGRSVVTNATIHCRQNYVFNIDLKDFFPSIDQARVWKRLQMKPFNLSQGIANVIAGLCCVQKQDIVDGEPMTRYVLPQGAPTSPIITNMICDKLDRRLSGLAKRFNLNYTRYADDITFSSMHNVYHQNGEFRKELRRIIADQNFTINNDKTRLQKRGERQEVTGLVVCEKPNVAREYARNIRNILYIWERHGLSVAMTKFMAKYRREKGHSIRRKPNMFNVIAGRLEYLKMVKGEKDSSYIRMCDKFIRLVNEATDSGKKKSGITYMETTELTGFEKKLSARINIERSKDGLSRFARIKTDKTNEFAFIAKNVEDEDLKQKSKFSISCCCDEQGHLFWLIYYKNKNR